ncbi:unnamed protein product [Clavelina lepadiformis]|uniref:Uncharacterized protein n=1 Tax=Clavelina lepadiformis TaxID=159417 RepID=A0ABP0FNL2_CLALP
MSSSQNFGSSIVCFPEHQVALKSIAMEMGFKQVSPPSPWSRLFRTTSLHVWMPTSHCVLKNICTLSV